MGNKKKKYNARFPPARIKKIMQTDEEVGKIAAPVPVVISRALELFLESIITESVNKANESNAKTLTSSHIKSVIQSNAAFDFLKSQVTLVPDLNADGGETSSTTDKFSSNAQLQNAAGLTGDAASAAPAAKKRNRPAPSTITKEEANQSDPKTPNKRKRGRPPKIKPGVKEEEGAVPTPPQSLSSMSSLKHETEDSTKDKSFLKEEPSLKSEPAVTTCKGEPAAAAASQSHAVTGDGQHSAQQLPVRPHPEMPCPDSIFSTDSSLIYKSGYPSTAAHSNSVISRYPPTTQSLHLNYPRGDITTIDSFQAMYGNLSPTSQPIDLSTKAVSAAIVGVDINYQHTVAPATNPYFYPSTAANGMQQVNAGDPLVRPADHPPLGSASNDDY